MKEPSFWEDLREVRAEWHDPEFRRGFISGFAPAFIRSFLTSALIGFIVVAVLIVLF